MAPPERRAAFTEFLALSAERALPSDIAQLMQETAHLLATEWLTVLRAGRQSYDLWRLRTMTAQPAGIPLPLD